MMIAAPNSARVTRRFGTKLTVAGGMIVTACALLLLTRATPHSGYLLPGTMLALLGIGMGTAMSPATESIMGSLPLAKAGVGSAVNDTTRQVGGALGVAVLGSITNAAYRSHVSTAASALPVAARSAVRAGVGNALAVAHTAHAPAIAAAAKLAFVHAMASTAYIGGAVALSGALVALLWLPARPAASEMHAEGEFVGDLVAVTADV